MDCAIQIEETKTVVSLGTAHRHTGAVGKWPERLITRETCPKLCLQKRTLISPTAV